MLLTTFKLLIHLRVQETNDIVRDIVSYEFEEVVGNRECFSGQLNVILSTIVQMIRMFLRTKIPYDRACTIILI